MNNPISPFEKWRLETIPQVGFTPEIRELLAMAFEGGRQSVIEKQEPVGKICLGCGTSISDEKLEEKKRHNKYLVSCCPDRQMVDVYTHPATWQSLSDDEMMKTIESCEDKLGRHLIGGLMIARAIEQALKEKNHE